MGGHYPAMVPVLVLVAFTSGDEFEKDLAAVVEGAQRPPRRAIAIDRVAEVDIGEVDAGCDRLCSLSLLVLAAQRDELVLRILPGDRGM